MNKQLSLVILICITILFSACQPAAPVAIEVTRVVSEKATQLVEVTRVVPQTVVVTHDVVVTSKPEETITETPTDSSTGQTDIGIKASAYLTGNAALSLPAGEPGKISVIAIGPRDSASSSVDIVVRNNTDKAVRRIAVSAVARTKDGVLFASGGDQGFHPNVVQPGEIAFGYVYFGSDVKLTPDLTLEFEETARPANDDEFENIRDLEVVEASFVANTRIVGMLRNQYSQSVTGPIQVTVFCFDAEGALLGYHSDFTDKDTAEPGDTIPYQVSIGEQCPTYLVSGSGFGSFK